MKNLFFVAVALGISAGTSSTVSAQSSKRAKQRTVAKSTAPVKFIEAIEIVPEGSSEASAVYVSTGGGDNAKEVSLPMVSNASSVIETCKGLQFKYALLTDREVESISNAQLYSTIDAWWGTRYRYGGSTHDGIDCSAFTNVLSNTVYNTNLPRTAKEQYDACTKLAIGELKEGDLVFFNTRGGVSHVGMYLGNNYFVHASTNNGVTISSMASGYYNAKFISGGRMGK